MLKDQFVNDIEVEFIEQAINFINEELEDLKRHQIFEFQKQIEEDREELSEFYYLSSLYTILIAQQDGYEAEVLKRNIMRGSYLQDIGLSQTDKKFLSVVLEELNEEEGELYKDHCRAGFNLANSFNSISENTKQIIYQSHECADGSGFPLGLSGIRNYRPALICHLGTELAREVLLKQTGFTAGVKSYLSSKDNVKKFPPSMIESLLDVARRKRK